MISTKFDKVNVIERKDPLLAKKRKHDIIWKNKKEEFGMKVVLPEEKALSKKQMIIYIGIIVTCIFAVILAFYVQFYARIDIGRLFGFETEIKLGNKTEEQIENLEVEFEHIFTSQMESGEEQNNKKIEK